MFNIYLVFPFTCSIICNRFCQTVRMFTLGLVPTGNCVVKYFIFIINLKLQFLTLFRSWSTLDAWTTTPVLYSSSGFLTTLHWNESRIFPFTLFHCFIYIFCKCKQCFLNCSIILAINFVSLFHKSIDCFFICH